MKLLNPNFIFLFVLSSFLYAVPPEHNPQPITFSQYEIMLGKEKYQTVLSGNLLGNSHSEFAVVSKDTLGKISLYVFVFKKNTWKESIELELPPNLLFVDIANIAGQDRFIYYQEGVFSWLNLEDGTSHVLLSINFDYSGTSEKQIPRVNMTKDLNGDSLDDFIIPGLEGFSLYIQNNEGTFSSPFTLGPPEPFLDLKATGDTRTYREVGLNALTIPWYLSRVHFYDHNLDGRKDLVFRNGDHYDVYIRTETGQFDSIPIPFNTIVTTGTDAPYSLAFQFSGKSGLPLVLGLRKSSTHIYMKQFSDINGDGVADMVTHTLTGRSPLKMKSKYTVYYGTPAENWTQFTENNSSAVFPSGKAGIGETAGYAFYWFHDFNNDNTRDLFRYDVRIGIGSIIRTLLFKTVYIEYEYFQNENNHFLKTPHITGLWKVNFDWDSGFYPAIKIGDITGDGKTEIVVSLSPIKLHVYSWDYELNMLSQDPHIVSTSVPGSELNTWLSDLNGDFKKDIIMYHPSDSSPHRLVVLIAQ